MARIGKRACLRAVWMSSASGAFVLLAGCEALAITALGVGASAGVSHTASSVSYRTFTASTAQVKKASVLALGKMGITVDEVVGVNGGELIKARSADRSIEIQLEAMSKSTTQMRTAAKRNVFMYDAATAKEIADQTALALAEIDRQGKKVPAASRPSAAVESSLAADMRPAVARVTARR